MMIELQKREDCSGCSACASICPVECIIMQDDFEGFKYPQVNKDKCVNCHKCEKVCPVINRPKQKGDKLKAYLARTKDDKLLQRCTSGGVFTEVARQIVKGGGVAYGVVYGENFTVKHERIADLSDIDRLPGSKYVQSDLGTIFLTVKKDIEAGKQVVFCGTPCQVAGLNNFIGKKCDNLLLFDLVCHGVPSPKLWGKYVAFLENKYGKLEDVNFRSKRLGYHISTMEESFVNGKSQIGSARTNLMSKCFFQNAADRPICYECPFKTVFRCSDFTIFDGWHASDYVQNFKDDDRGYTIILAQSEESSKYIESQDYLKTIPINMAEAISKDGKMVVNSVSKPKSRDDFYQLLDSKGIENTVKILFPITRMDYAIEKLKLLLDKLGILRKIKAMKSG